VGVSPSSPHAAASIGAAVSSHGKTPPLSVASLGWRFSQVRLAPILAVRKIILPPGSKRFVFRSASTIAMVPASAALASRAQAPSAPPIGRPGGARLAHSVLAHHRAGAG
jgi:hypothetical protein